MRTAKCEFTGKQIHLCGCKWCQEEMKKINASIKQFEAEIKSGKIKGKDLKF